MQKRLNIARKNFEIKKYICCRLSSIHTLTDGVRKTNSVINGNNECKQYKLNCPLYNIKFTVDNK